MARPRKVQPLPEFPREVRWPGGPRAVADLIEIDGKEIVSITIDDAETGYLRSTLEKNHPHIHKAVFG